MKKIQRLVVSTAAAVVLAAGISGPAMAQSAADTQQRLHSVDSTVQPQLVQDSFCYVFGRFFRNC